MADWNEPDVTDLYVDFRDLLVARDLDAFTLGLNAVTNPPTGAIRYDRTDDHFQEWDGSAWVDLIISLEGGGTGAANAPDVRTALGIGTIATQNANAVNITGGTIAGLGSLGVNGAATFGGTLDVTGIITGIGSGLTALHGPNIATGLINVARLGTGTPDATKFLRGDGAWAETQMIQSIQRFNVASGSISGVTFYDVTLPTTLTDYTKAVIIPVFFAFASGSNALVSIALTSNTNMRFTFANTNVTGVSGSFQIVEFK